MEVDQLGDWRRTHYSREIKPEMDGKEVVVFGWVQEIRDLGGIRFVILQDREGTVQITIHRDQAKKELIKKADSLQRQYSIGVRGVAKKTEMTQRGIEVIPEEIRTLGVAQHPLPLDITGRTPAEIDVRLDARVLDLCREEGRAIFRIRHTVLEAAFLAQSPQLYKEQLTLSLDKVFEIGPFFRAEESHTRIHLNEFISVDIEQAFATAEDVMSVLEKLIRHVCGAIKEICQKELEALEHQIEVPKGPLERFTYDEILEQLERERIHVPWGEDLPTLACRKLGKLHPYFYFITDWPAESKTFYIKPRDDTPKLCEGFDLMWRWIEIASGGTRVHSKQLLVERLRKQGLNPESFKHHLKAFDYGMPPHAGWAIGLDRLMMMLTGRKNIREVVLFPRDRFRLTP